MQQSRSPMQRYARLSAAIIFGVATLFATAVPMFFYKLPDSGFKLPDTDALVWSQLPPALIFGALWPPVLVAALLGAAFGGLFARTASLRLGIFYAACLGILISLPIPFIAMLSYSRLNEYIFALTFTAFDSVAATVPIAIAQLSGSSTGSLVGSSLAWVLYPLTGVLVWLWLRARLPRR